MAITRQDLILKYIVEEYIKYAQPVGSSTLIKKYNLPFSSATIRNEMAELEQRGLLEKEHTSSGRIPSTKGYEYYFDKIKSNIDDTEVDKDFKREFQLILSKKAQSVEDVLKRSCEILSEVTSMATVVLGPKADEEHVLFINSAMLPSNTQMSIYLMTDKGYTESKTFMIKDSTEAASISKCIEIINNRLNGASISELTPKINAMRPVLAQTIGQSSEVVIDALAEAFVNFANQRLKTYGSEKKLIDLPDYEQDAKKIQTVIDLINDPNKVASLVDESAEGDCSLVLSNDDSDVAILSQDCKISDFNSKLAVIGPHRMDYKKVMTLMKYMVNELNKYFGEGDIKKDEIKKEKKGGKNHGRKG